MTTPRVHELCLWLRDYASTRLCSQLMDERRCMPPYVVMDLGNRGVLGLLAAPAYDGGGFSQEEALAVFEQLGAIDLTLAVFVGIHNGLGIRPIERFGSDALKAELVPQLASGRILGAFAMTEPAAGSNARNIEAQAIAHGGDGWRLRGTKLWVGNGSWAGVINVVARRPPDEGGGMSAFAVRTGTRGVRMGPEALTTGMRAIVQNELVLDDVPVTHADLLGAPGDGFAVADDMFAIARLGISAIALGGLRRCVQLAHRFASRRTINTGPHLANARTREVLAQMLAASSAASRLLAHTAARCDGLAPPPHLAAICKAVVPELLGEAADAATQLLGGRGYIETNELPRIVRDARLLRIFEGPTELLAMHLGSAILGNALSLDELFAGLDAPHARGRVERWTQTFATALEGKAGDARVLVGQQVKLAIGEVAAWGLLAAAAEAHVASASATAAATTTATIGASAIAHAAATTTAGASAIATDGDAVGALAARWSLARLESRAAALARTLESPLLLAPEVLARAVADLRDAIGDVEQTLPGEDHALDTLLRRGPS